MTALPPLAQSLLDAIAEPSLLIRASRIIAANPAARQLFGNGIEGKDVRLAIRHPAALDLILGGRPGETDLMGIGGVDRPWRLSLIELGGGNALVRLTDQAALRAAERMRVDFVANASHELRTPLATVTGYAETLADEEQLDEATRRSFGATIRAEATRMLRLIEELMSLSRIEADRFRPPSEMVSAADVIALAMEQCAEFARRRGASIDATIDPGLPRFRGDQRQLVQLVDNLVTNAIRYGCSGEGNAVAVTAGREGSSLVLTVRDSGQGIAAEHLPRLTERFYRVDAARSSEDRGTGLGLAIVKHIVERHRGTLAIRSAPGAGTEVIVRLPIE